jgi:hypothetical protein
VNLLELQMLIAISGMPSEDVFARERPEGQAAGRPATALQVRPHAREAKIRTQVSAQSHPVTRRPKRDTRRSVLR